MPEYKVPEYIAASERLDELAAMTDGWFDGAGARTSTAALGAARDTLELLSADELPVPRIYPTMDGGVRFEWTIGDADAALEADATGVLEMFVIRQDSNDDANAYLTGERNRPTPGQVAWLLWGGDLSSSNRLRAQSWFARLVEREREQ